MKRFIALFFLTLLHCSTQCAATPTTFVKDTWTTVKNSVSSIFERSESSVFTRELEIPEKSRITIKNLDGAVAITRSKSSTKLFIEAEKKGKKSFLKSTLILAQTKDLTTAIETKNTDPAKLVPVYYTIAVPDSATVVVEQRNGDILVRDVKCSLSLQTSESGSITIENAVNSVTARALKGSITLIQAELSTHSSLFLEAYRSIELTLSKKIDATLSAQTLEGFITSDIPVTLDPITTRITRDAWRDLRRNVHGNFGHGGPSIVLDSTKGPIRIMPFDVE